MYKRQKQGRVTLANRSSNLSRINSVDGDGRHDGIGAETHALSRLYPEVEDTRSSDTRIEGSNTLCSKDRGTCRIGVKVKSGRNRRDDGSPEDHEFIDSKSTSIGGSSGGEKPKALLDSSTDGYT